MGYPFGLTSTFTSGGGAAGAFFGTPVTIVGTVGASQSGAAQIVAPYTVVTGSGGNVSAILPTSPVIGQEYVVELAGDATQLCLFPQVGGQIDTNGTNAFFLCNTNSLSQINRLRVRLVPTSNTQWKSLGTFADYQSSVANDTAGGRHYAQHDFHGTTNFEGGVGFTFPNALAPSGTTQTVDWSTGNSITVDATNTTGTLVLTFANPVNGGRYALKTIGKLSRLWTFPTVKWAAGTPPTVTATAGAIDLFEFVYDGTNYLGRIFAQNMS